MKNSKLFDEKTFFEQFIRDLICAKSEVIIESPFITTKRMNQLAPLFEKLVDRGIKIYVVTRDPKVHRFPYSQQAEVEIQHFEQIGVQPLICPGYHNRTLAILDRYILWVGSIHILSHYYDAEIMRRINDKTAAEEMFNFLKYSKNI